MTKHLSVSLLCAAAILFISQSCNKKGDPGNVVNVSDTFKLASADYVNGYWSVETGGGSLGINARIATRDVPKITQKIFSSGTVLVYLKVPNGLSATSTQYTLLPFSIRSFSVGWLTRLSFTYEVGKIRIYYYYEQTDAAGAAAPSVYSAVIPEYSFKYVVIPGSEGFRSAYPPVDYHDYNAVKAYYNLPD